jgi:CheY-like chemotaxis protein
MFGLGVWLPRRKRAVPAKGAHGDGRSFSLREAARILCVPQASITAWIRERHCEAVRRPRRRRRIAAADLVRFARDRRLPIPEALRALAITKVLVIDDEQLVLSALRRSLKSRSDEFCIEMSSSSVQGLSLIGSFQPTVLLLDIRMPGLDGLEVMERLRTTAETKDLLVVAMSGYMDEGTTERCIKLGAAACLSKPVSGSALCEALKELRPS